MAGYLVRRLLAFPLVLLGVSVLLFAITMLLTPAQRAVSFIRSEKQLNNIQAVVHQYGLNKPFPEQYLTWLKQVLHGNLGWSQSAGMPVSTAITTYLPATAELAIYAFIPIVLVGIFLGVAAAINRDRFVDQSARVISIVGWSLPSFVVAIWLLQIFYGYLHWFEPGRLSLMSSLIVSSPDFHHYTGMMTVDAILNGQWNIFWSAASHLILPVITLVVVGSAQLVRVMRSSMLDALEQDFVRTARAKGLTSRSVIYKHALRNALIPVITLSGLIFFGLLQGVVITETVFNYPGLGNWAAHAATQLDIPAVLGYALFAALVVSVANLLVDLLYGLIDPRIRYD